MAKKKTTEFKRYAVPLPHVKDYDSNMRLTFGGLDLRNITDTGSLSCAENISFDKYPNIRAALPLQRICAKYTENCTPISFLGMDDFFAVVYKIKTDTQKGIYIDVIKPRLGARNDYDKVVLDFKIYTSKNPIWDKDPYDYAQRTLLRFNTFSSDTDVVGGSYTKKLILLPDGISFDYDITEDFEVSVLKINNIKTFETEIPENADKAYYWRNTKTNMVYAWNTETDSFTETTVPAFPTLHYGCVHASRLFGVDDAKIYAGGFNDYANWALDTADEYAESNAWVSAAQSNTKASSAFTGIYPYNGHVICFKQKFMHEIYNTKNPFRIVDIYAEGCIDNRSIQEINGKLYFASDSGIKLYTGGLPQDVSEALNIQKLSCAIAGTDGNKYYLYAEHDGKKKLYVLDTVCGLWSERTSPLFDFESRPIIGFVQLERAVYAMDDAGYIYKMETETAKRGAYDLESEISESTATVCKAYHKRTVAMMTELQSSGTLDIKHIKKLLLLYRRTAQTESATPLTVTVYIDGKSYAASDRYITGTGSAEYGVVRFRPRYKGHSLYAVSVTDFADADIQALEIQIEGGGDLYG